MTTVLARIGDFHFPSWLVTLVVLIAAGFTVNGNPIDLSTPEGRGVAAAGVVAIVIKAIKIWIATK